MEYRFFGDTCIARFDRGEEILSCLTEICRKEDIHLASIDALGALDHAVLCLYDVENKVFYRKSFDEPMEMSNLCGTATRKDGEVYLHLHATVCDRELNAHGGHAAELRVSATAEMVIRVINGEVGRRMDDTVGLNVFHF